MFSTIDGSSCQDHCSVPHRFSHFSYLRVSIDTVVWIPDFHFLFTFQSPVQSGIFLVNLSSLSLVVLYGLIRSTFFLDTPGLETISKRHVYTLLSSLSSPFLHRQSNVLRDLLSVHHGDTLRRTSFVIPGWKIFCGTEYSSEWGTLLF